MSSRPPRVPQLKARVVDLDGSVASQSRLISRLGDLVEMVNLRALGPSVRYLPTESSSAELDTAILSLEPSWLTFTGSGDFHHITASILKRIDAPFSLIAIDQHSDWIGSSPCPCGAWLREAMKLPNIERIVTLGVGRQSIQGWLISHAPLSDILSGRIELYPLDCKQSQCLGRRKGNPVCAKLKPGWLMTRIHWTTIADSGWETVTRQAVGYLPNSHVYLSIDKDCLAPDHAFTNWGNGTLTLDQLVWAISLIRESRELIGVDVCGEWSPVKVTNSVLNKMAVRTHPKAPEPTSADLAKNEQTNLTLLDALGL